MTLLKLELREIATLSLISFFTVFTFLFYGSFCTSELTSTLAKTIIVAKFSLIPFTMFWLAYFIYEIVSRAMPLFKPNKIHLWIEVVVLSLLSFIWFYYVEKFHEGFISKNAISIYCVINLLVIGIFFAYYNHKMLNHALISLETKGEKNSTVFVTIKDNYGAQAIFDVSTLMLAQSMGNYVVLYFDNNGILDKKILRFTLKSMVEKLAEFSQIKKVHRTALINIHYISKISKHSGKLLATIDLLDKEVPISPSFDIAELHLQ